MISTRMYLLGFPGGSDSKESSCNAGDQGSIPRLEKSAGEGIALFSGGIVSDLYFLAYLYFPTF